MRSGWLTSINPLIPSGLFTAAHWTGPFPIEGVSGYFLTLPYLKKIVFNANSVDPDQTPRSAASDLGLHCLPMSLLWDARHKWINI